LKDLTTQAIQAYTPAVEEIIRTNSHNTCEVDHLLDGMLGFCYDAEMLLLFKKLCRYYYGIDPVTTAEYVYAYRDMWDEDKKNV
jgi:hypothetical protein